MKMIWNSTKDIAVVAEGIDHIEISEAINLPNSTCEEPWIMWVHTKSGQAIRFEVVPANHPKEIFDKVVKDFLKNFESMGVYSYA